MLFLPMIWIVMTCGASGRRKGGSRKQTMYRPAQSGAPSTQAYKIDAQEWLRPREFEGNLQSEGFAIGKYIRRQVC